MATDNEPAPAKALTKNPLGPVGHALAVNIKRLIGEQKLTYAELSANLEELGRPIPPLGLRKIVGKTRRVDADDLIALAIALSTSPASLLMPDIETAKADDQVRLMDKPPTVSAKRAWNWLTARDRIANFRFSAFVERSWPTWERERYEEQLLAEHEYRLAEASNIEYLTQLAAAEGPEAENAKVFLDMAKHLAEHRDNRAAEHGDD
jgi:hypothetical protein